MTNTENKALDIDFSFKKNNVDELFFNLSENPEGFKNKDFRYTLSLIYQTVEDEFEGVFLSPNAPTRNTDFYLVNNNEKSLTLIASTVLDNILIFSLSFVFIYIFPGFKLSVGILSLLLVYFLIFFFAFLSFNFK